MVRKKGIPKVLGLNINGDIGEREILKIVKSFDLPIWIGENPLFKDPFYIADLIADYVSFVGFGVVTVKRGCSRILKYFEKIASDHRDTEFALGIGSGSLRGRSGLKAVLDCLKFLRDRVDFLFCGCSSPIITSESSKIVDGILFNHAHPEHLKWLIGFLKRDVIKVAFAPSLILPSEFEKDLLVACAIVSCNRALLREFRYGIDFSNLDFKRVIIERKIFDRIPKEIERFRDLLIDKFAIAGDLESFVLRVKEILKVCDHVVLGDPFFRDERSLSMIGDILKLI